MGIRKASRAEIPVWSVAEMGAEVSDSVVTCPEISNPPKVEVVTEIIIGGSSAEIGETLADKILEVKVL